MTFELSTDEVEIISGWYAASAGESAHDRSETLFGLLDKFGIHAHHMDLYKPNPEHVIPQARHKVQAEVDAIAAYRLRHPDFEEVIEAEEESQSA